MALDVDRIAEAGLRLLDEVGLDRLSTRSLAAALDVQGPALYKHFPSKADLLDHMATAMLTSAFADLDRDASWQDWLRGLATNGRRAMLRHRDGARLLVATSPSAPNRSRLALAISQPLLEKGLDYRSTRLSAVIMASFVEGWVLNEQNEATSRMMRADLGDLDRSFLQGVDAIIAGISGWAIRSA